jgi:hypothetical protein
MDHVADARDAAQRALSYLAVEPSRLPIDVDQPIYRLTIGGLSGILNLRRDLDRRQTSTSKAISVYRSRRPS